MKNTILIYVVIMTVATVSCKKYLDKKPNDSMAIIETVGDAQLLLDQYENISSRYPRIADILADDYYLTSADWLSANTEENPLHTWQKVNQSTAWTPCFTAIFNCNTVLDALDRIKAKQNITLEFNHVLGSALFLRSYYFFSLSQLYIPIYDEKTAEADLGLPLRLNSDFSVKSTRSSVEETYKQIVYDLKKSIQMLPDYSQIKTRPSKGAAYGALAKVYLSMRKYKEAGLYADSCLQLNTGLLDFNQLSQTAAAPIPRFNKEVVFHIRSQRISTSIINPNKAKIDPDLYASYVSDDLRKAIFFKANAGAATGTYSFKGDYDQTGTAGLVFGGIVTDEMYLIRSECYARDGKTQQALRDLNDLLRTRWKLNSLGQTTFVDYTVTDREQLIDIILLERRKELLYRGTRWTDLRRLSKEPSRAVIPKRIVDNIVFRLEPGSSNYILWIPEDVIKISGMPQNP